MELTKRIFKRVLLVLELLFAAVLCFIAVLMLIWFFTAPEEPQRYVRELPNECTIYNEDAHPGRVIEFRSYGENDGVMIIRPIEPPESPAVAEFFSR